MLLKFIEVHGVGNLGQYITPKNLPGFPFSSPDLRCLHRRTCLSGRMIKPQRDGSVTGA